MSRRNRRIGENLYSRRFWGSMKIRDDCKNIQPLNYEVNPAELLEKFPTSPGHTFLLFSNWPCHFRLINSPLPSPTFLPLAVDRIRRYFRNVVLIPSFISTIPIFQGREFLTKLVSSMKSFGNVFSFFLMETRYKFMEGTETSALSCDILNLNINYRVTFQFSQKKRMIYLYCKRKLNEICWNALDTTPPASYYVIIILANLLLSLIQELILRYLRNLSDLSVKSFRSNLKPHLYFVSNLWINFPLFPPQGIYILWV